MVLKQSLMEEMTVTDENWSKYEAPPRSSEPPGELLELIAAQELLSEARLSGSSIKYFRSGQPAASLVLSAETFQVLWSGIKAGSLQFRGDDLRVALQEDEIKLTLNDVSSNTGYHLNIRPQRERFTAGNIEPNELLITIDELYYDRVVGEWRGSEEGRADLLAEKINLIAPDKLSPELAFRLVVLSSRLDFELTAESDERCLAVLGEHVRNCENDIFERKFLKKEFKKLLCGARPSRALIWLDEAGVLSRFFPELSAGKGVSQNRYHRFDVFYHCLYACDAVKKSDFILRAAALFHDLGKVATRKEKGNGEASFHNHEFVSANIVHNFMKRFDYSPALTRRVKFLVRNHMFHYTSEWSDRAVKRFIKKVHPDAMEDLITLRLADREGSGKRTELPRAIKAMMRHIEEVRQRESELKITDLAINGHSLMEMGLKPGPQMGVILQRLLEDVKSGELENDPEVLKGAAAHRLELQSEL